MPADGEPVDVFRAPGYVRVTATDHGVIPASVVVCYALATALRCDPGDIPPLGDAVDPDGVDRLFAESRSDPAPTLRFRYRGRNVLVERAERTVTVTVVPPSPGQWDGGPDEDGPPNIPPLIPDICPERHTDAQTDQVAFRWRSRPANTALTTAPATSRRLAR